MSFPKVSEIDVRVVPFGSDAEAKDNQKSRWWRWQGIRYITEYLILGKGCNHLMKIKCYFKAGKSNIVALLVKSQSVYSKLLTTAQETKPGTKYSWVKYVQA